MERKQSSVNIKLRGNNIMVPHPINTLALASSSLSRALSLSGPPSLRCSTEDCYDRHMVTFLWFLSHIFFYISFSLFDALFTPRSSWFHVFFFFFPNLSRVRVRRSWFCFLYFILCFPFLCFLVRRCRISKLLITRALNSSSSAMEELVIFSLFLFNSFPPLLCVCVCFFFNIFLFFYNSDGVLLDAFSGLCVLRGAGFSSAVVVTSFWFKCLSDSCWLEK